MPVIQSPETVLLLQLYSKYARSELYSAARHYGIPEPSWPVNLQHGTDYFLPYIVALIAIRLGDSLDVHAAHQYYQVLYLIIVTSRQILNMPMVNKQLSMWSESMSTLLMVHHYGRPTHALTELRRRLRRLRIHPNMYTFTHFLQPNAVYWKQRVELRPDLPRSVNPQSDVYIGSTGITYPSREHNRRAKLLGIQHGQFINAEPALRWWHHFGNYDEFATWVIFTDSDHTVTWTQEHALISIYQPSLNWPYIYRRYKRISTGYTANRFLAEQPWSRFGKRLFLRLRRRSCTVYGRNFHRVALKHTQAWSIIARLTSEHIESWEEEKRLRSGRHSDLDIYAIYRLSGNVEQPHRHRVRNILRRVLDFRQLQQPKINLLLRLPWLSHPHYQRSTREVLRRLVLDHRNWALPLHLPSTKLAETPHPRVHTVMWNFSSFQDSYLRMWFVPPP